MAGHIHDRWTRPGAGGRRVRTDRWGRGKRWLARWVDPDGKERSKACDTKDEAAALLAQVSVDIGSGAYVSPTAGRETFNEYAERWRAQQLHHRPATATQAESRLRVHVYPDLGPRPMASIRRSDVQALMTKLATSLAPATVEVIYGYVATIFRAAMEDRVIATTPCVRISLPELQQAKVIPMTLAQVEAVRAAVPPRWRAMVDLAAASGLRSGELRGLTVDRLSPALHIRGVVPAAGVVVRVDRQLASVGAGGRPVFGPPKTPAADRSVRLGASTAQALVTHLQEFGVGLDGLVFSSPRGGGLSRSRAGEAWRAGIASVEGLRERSGWHDLRHFNASLLIREGLSVRAVADRLGHEDPAETLRTYSHLWPDDEERAVAAVESVLRDLGRTTDGPGEETPRSEAEGP